MKRETEAMEAAEKAAEYLKWYLDNKTTTGFTLCMDVIPESFIAGLNARSLGCGGGLKWVKASERLPEIDNKKPKHYLFRNDVNHHAINIWTEFIHGFPPLIMAYKLDWEWLDETGDNREWPGQLQIDKIMEERQFSYHECVIFQEAISWIRTQIK